MSSKLPDGSVKGRRHGVRRRLPSIALAFLTLGLAGVGTLPALGQVPFAQGGLPLTQTGRAEGLTPEIEQILKGMLATYRSLDAYADGGRVSILQETGRIQQATKMPSSVVFEKPRRIAVVGGMQTVACDGEQLQIVLDAIQQYQQRPAPPRLSMDTIRMGAPGGGLEQGYPEVLEFLLGSRVYERWISVIDSIALVQRDEPTVVANRECIEISYHTIHRALVTLSIDKETSLLLRADIDNTKAQRPASGPQASTPAPVTKIVMQLDPVRIGADALADRTFALRDVASAGMRLVTEFNPENTGGAPDPGGLVPGEGQHPLIGNAVPAISATDTNGQPVEPAEFEGRPALYFIWTPKGDPGSLAAVSMIDRLVKKLGNPAKRLLVLGISTNTEDPNLAADVLAAKKASYRNVADINGTLLRGFGVSGVPTFILASSDGTVKEVLQGPPDEVEDNLTAKLKALLRPSPIRQNEPPAPTQP